MEGNINGFLGVLICYKCSADEELFSVAINGENEVVCSDCLIELQKEYEAGLVVLEKRKEFKVIRGGKDETSC